MRSIKPAIELILIAFTLVMILALMCDYFNVYLPGVVYLIPARRRPTPYHKTPVVISHTRRPPEKLIVIEKEFNSPSPEIQEGNIQEKQN